ncbi:MltR family transcriptional regulator [Pseudomonas sp. ABFPK]|uniref:MltR family transcriptional regulator n=1 Tax=Pseudomonas sp. ABFPK TaxID=1636605 RepID=UPI000778E43E|nr:MltR family transcriptional regulator [Pseudomonas sp. ABFPK]KYC15870.1 hypothetical protein WM94_24170 [Pseudomonas sp. ABFPK]
MKKEDMESSEPQGFINFNEIARTLKDLDERALVLTLAAFAEDSLGDLLTAFMIPSAASRSLVTGFNAPLGNFSSRIKAAYAFGLINKGQFDDLQHLREVRNKFSHTWKPISFTDPSIEGHIKAIRYSRRTSNFPKTLQQKLTTSFQNLLIELQVGVISFGKDGKQAKCLATQLISGFSGNTPIEQLERATKEAAQAESKHGIAVGEEKLYYDMVLRELLIRVKRFLGTDDTQISSGVADLIERLTKTLADRPEPTEIFR